MNVAEIGVLSSSYEVWVFLEPCHTCSCSVPGTRNMPKNILYGFSVPEKDPNSKYISGRTQHRDEAKLIRLLLNA